MLSSSLRRTTAVRRRLCRRALLGERSICTKPSTTRTLYHNLSLQQSQSPPQHRSSTPLFAHQLPLNQRRWLSSSDVAAMPSVTVSKLRNVAIIAHVDHGKTTLVDCLLQDSGNRFGNDLSERVMDSYALERERGITILAKTTSVYWNNTDTTLKNPEEEAIDTGIYRVNIMDTPGHADFGGEVERVMSMVDGVCLVVCATEGPMAQTKFVLSKALKHKLAPVVVINKVDRDSARVHEVENEIFDLFVDLGADDDQLEYPVVYASARDGWATRNIDLVESKNTEKLKAVGMKAIFDAVLSRVHPPRVQEDAPFSMLVSLMDRDDHFGNLVVGRVQSGRVQVGDRISALDEEGNVAEEIRVLRLLSRQGLSRVPTDSVSAGDVCAIAGFKVATVNYTIGSEDITDIIPSTPIDPPTISMTFSVNTSPLSGQEGDKVASSAIAARLTQECQTNVSLTMVSTGSQDAFEIHARGEMQLGVLMEQMRREGFEIAVSPPRVVFRTNTGERFVPPHDREMSRAELEALDEPIEEVIMDVSSDVAGSLIEKMTRRKADLLEMEPNPTTGRTTMKFHIPTRGFLGFRAEFVNDTRGDGILQTSFYEYQPYKGTVEKRPNGALISMAAGVTTPHALNLLQVRGKMFIGAGENVYPGMVIGESATEHDLDVNPVKKKELSNVRNVLAEDKVKLLDAKTMTIEQLISYVRDDEMIEVTPKSIRLRKKELDANKRRKFKRDNK